ncbi:MAG: PqqD family protein [Clostridia bacterium]|nr:PqqD family protein [Clostridia bacterium]
MKLVSEFEIVNIADDYMLVPVGSQMEKFNGTVVLNDVSAFLLEQLKTDRTKEELVRLLMETYDVDTAAAQADVDMAIEKMKKIGIIYE